MTRRVELTAALEPLLAVEGGWSEDPMIVLHALTKQAHGMVTLLSQTQPGAHCSHAYWTFVAEECDRLSERIFQRFNNA